ncbi:MULTISPECIES: 30S ribosomal protein S8 [unclassified Nitratiruptor]|uniref:Small ribosomal subunit protein uS8 n=1 Tax=Nitratiruptor sp. (strain SB155-2) TaxID=387092 RepID=RS8_NITSB|nr:MULTISPECIES: 30S ribosomal protein S8 [unclassified Nitratiruptor]A6Q1J2.1 RecName: Full=Small ribosomal subunit protein uS8; AltName: Full=30S ribosomal protein S8 [Nitratiruptor sp. SB155-2]BAF69351.1 30S ribosomal protein S8 [Nitratiruptor sp. SB155-2]BCD59506.1 small subunit ribosomal protein S8 [Nitratiruptor sp. YY08-10]BCD63430.1 small subunit ribosomal protein S8 [Nitratiruptor sp. YY08-14]
MVNDIIADSITRIRNASIRGQEVTKLLYSKIVEAIVKILQEKGYIESYKVVEEGNKKFINVVLKYEEAGKKKRPVINEIKRISKPGRRIYKGKDEIKRFKNGYGTIIVSTSKGVLPNDEAYRLGVGGEVLCSVW